MASVGERRSTLLFHSALVRVADVSCRAPRCRSGEEECSSEGQVVVPRRWVFIVHRRLETAVVDTNTALVLGSGEPYRVSHPAAGGDDCTVFVFAPDVLEARSAGPTAGSAL